MNCQTSSAYESKELPQSISLKIKDLFQLPQASTCG